MYAYISHIYIFRPGAYVSSWNGFRNSGVDFFVRGWYFREIRLCLLYNYDIPSSIYNLYTTSINHIVIAIRIMNSIRTTRSNGAGFCLNGRQMYFHSLSKTMPYFRLLSSSDLMLHSIHASWHMIIMIPSYTYIIYAYR